MKLKYLFFSLILSFLIFLNSAFAEDKSLALKPLSFYYLPNLNLTFSQNNDSYVLAQEVLGTIKKDSDVDFVVFGGNLTENIDGTYSDIPFFTDLADNLEKKYYVIFGSNDARLSKDYSLRDFTSEFRKNGFNIPEITYWNDDTHCGYNLIGLDTTVINSSKGEISKEQYAWFEQVLKTYNKPTVVFMYHSSIDTGINVVDDLNLANSKQFVEFVAKFPQIKLVISGNTGMNSVKQVGSTFYVNSPSITSYPNMYPKITLYSDRIEIKRSQIPYKQLIKKYKIKAANSKMAIMFNAKKPSKFLKVLEGDKFSNQSIYYFPLK